MSGESPGTNWLLSNFLVSLGHFWGLHDHIYSAGNPSFSRYVSNWILAFPSSFESPSDLGEGIINKMKQKKTNPRESFWRSFMIWQCCWIHQYLIRFINIPKVRFLTLPVSCWNIHKKALKGLRKEEDELYYPRTGLGLISPLSTCKGCP